MFLKSLKQNYPHLFLLLSIVILLVGLLYRGEDTTLDINVHDTYYVIEHILINIFFQYYHFLFGLFIFFCDYSDLK